MHAATRIADAPTGRLSIIMVIGDDLDTYVPVTSRTEAELVATELWGLDPGEIDHSEVGTHLSA